MRETEARAAWEKCGEELERVAWLALADRWHGACRMTAAQLVADALGYGWQSWLHWAPRRDAADDNVGAMRHRVRMGVRDALRVYSRQRRGGIPMGELFDAPAPDVDWSAVERIIAGLPDKLQRFAELLAHGIGTKAAAREAHIDRFTAMGALRTNPAIVGLLAK